MLYIYCVCLQESFANVNGWLETLQHHADLIQMVIVGNKCDMEKTIDDYVSIEYGDCADTLSHALLYYRPPPRGSINKEEGGT